MATKKIGSEKSTSVVALQREFRKSNDAIGLRVTEGNLSLLSRKVFNVMIYHAQQMKEPGTNAPLSSPTAKKYFWIPLSTLAKDASYDSRDTQNLKDVLEDMQNIKLSMESDRQWTSERLLSSVTLVNPSSVNKNSGQVWLGFAFPPEMHEQVMAPSTYTKLSIAYQSLLRSGASLALYEICRRFATNPSKLTYIQTIEHWHSQITGSPSSERKEVVYKYFKRDILKMAIAEVNKITDIVIEVREIKNGRRIVKLQFQVELKKQARLEFPAPAVIDTALMERIMRFGLSQADACDVMALNTDDVVRLACDRVETRLAVKGLAPLDAPSAYFRWAIANLNATNTKPVQAIPAKSLSAKKVLGEDLMTRFLTARAKDAYAVYQQLGDANGKDLFIKFKAQNSNKSLKLELGVTNPMVRSLFSRWYANDLWGEPTAAALAEFVVKFGSEPEVSAP